MASDKWHVATRDWACWATVSATTGSPLELFRLAALQEVVAQCVVIRALLRPDGWHPPS
jgi:hypothetical protein